MLAELDPEIAKFKIFGELEFVTSKIIYDLAEAELVQLTVAVVAVILLADVIPEKVKLESQASFVNVPLTPNTVTPDFILPADKLLSVMVHDLVPS